MQSIKKLLKEKYQNKKLLRLTLNKQWFALMCQGLKTNEYRKPTDWIKSRLNNRTYDYVLFVNGYGDTKPFFICKYAEHYKWDEGTIVHRYYGSSILVENGDYIISLGLIKEVGNYEI